MAPPLSLQLLINGLLVGIVFALAAYGMALVWGVMNVINIAQGDFVVLEALSRSCLRKREPIPFSL